MEKFHTAIVGYDKKEVNKFVSDVIVEVEKIMAKDRQKSETIVQLNEKVTRYHNMENTLNRVVLVAEEASHQIKKMARTEGDSIIEEAKKNASRIINDALMKAEEAEKEANTLRRNVQIYKKRIRSIIEDQLDAIDSLDKEEL